MSDSRSRLYLRFACEWLFLIGCIITGWFLGLNYYNIILCIVGWSMFILGMLIHERSHREHPKAHCTISEIDYVATRGVYSWVRHPGYLGLALAYFGLAIAYGSIPGLIAALILTAYLYHLACKEERLMLEKFGEAYAKYMQEVPDRFIPIRKLIRGIKHRKERVTSGYFFSKRL